MKIRKREIAKVGIFGSKDNPQIVNEKDLKEIAETFAEIQKAPISLNGHWPDPASPRLGNVVSVSYDEATKTLTGEIEEEDALAEAVDAGYYPDVSIGARQRASDGKMYLHHLAYLGEEPPAIKDLVKEIKTDLGIAAGDAAGGRILPSPTEKRLYLSENPPENTFLKNMGMESPGPKSGAEQPSSPEGSSGTAGGGGDSAKTNEEVQVDEKEAQKLREENERLKAENEKNAFALSDAEKRKQEADRERLKAAMDGKKVPQAIREKALRLCDAMDNGKTVELSDSEAPEGKRSVSAVDCLIEIITAMPKPVETGVMNLSDGEEDASANTTRINFGAI
ncbi:MAG: hypothetical protein LBQ89_01945 [Treponema sp.]|jgi:hypothetical protein|nr:hypothetical protein [Treponema sp.]